MENNSQIIIYITEKGETKLEVRLENETVWLKQKLMAELFQTTIPNINMHLKNIFATGQAMRRMPMYMKDWIEKLHGFLKLNDRNILNNAGKISHQLAIEKAEKEYNKYNLRIYKTIESDFDKAIKKLEAPKHRKKKGE